MRRDVRAIVGAGILVAIGFGCVATAEKVTKTEGTSVSSPATISLPTPRLDRDAPLMQALKNRKSTRNYSDAKLSLNQLSDLLWCANGVNRDSGKHTSPSPHNLQGVDIYVVLEEGAYVYDPAKNVLNPVADGDHRAATGTQAFVGGAALNLVYVADSEVIKLDKVMVAIPVGCMVQNVGLYCASEGLGNVVRGWFKPKELSKALDLKPSQSIYITQTVGVPK